MKKKLEPANLLYPTPTVLIGAEVEGKPNFITIAHIGILSHQTPLLVSFSMAKVHYTNQGITGNRQFSVNIPSESLVAKTDYCGIVSGRNKDKSSLFNLFYGDLEHAPMISECPVNMACKLFDNYILPTHDLFIGEIVETYADESVLKDDIVDISRVKPLLFDMSSKKYWALGNVVAGCWNIGKSIKK